MRRASGSIPKSVGLLISSPNAKVHYHADVPGQSLWQLRGEKRVFVYPDRAPFLRDGDIENVVRGVTEEEIHYEPWYDAHAQGIDLMPGEMMHWPLNAPHRVDNLDCMNVSITTEHWTPAIRRNFAMRYGNGLLRQHGWTPKSKDLYGPNLWAKVALTAAWRLRASRSASPSAARCGSISIRRRRACCGRSLPPAEDAQRRRALRALLFSTGAAVLYPVRDGLRHARVILVVLSRNDHHPRHPAGAGAHGGAGRAVFVDWNTHRGWVEERLSAALGGRVEVGGDIDLRLLPAPRMALDLSWRGAGEGAPRIDVDRAQLEIAVAPLLQGIVRFVEARLERPRVSASLGADGAVGLPQPERAEGSSPSSASRFATAKFLSPARARNR